MDTGESSQAAQFNASGQFSTIRTGRTVREYDQEIEELRKENFDLKLRLYLLEVRTSKGGGDNNENGPLEVDVQLTYEAESLRNEIITKNKLLQDALSQAEKYGVDLEVALKENSQLQARIDSILKDTDLRLKELTEENAALKETTRKSSIAIKGFVKKFKEEYDLLPQELQPIIVNAVHAAKESNKQNVVSHVNNFKDYLCQIMQKSYEDVFEGKRSFSSTSEQIQCLEQELYKQKMSCKNLEKKVSGLLSEPRKPSQESGKDAEKVASLQSHKQSLEQQPEDDVLHDLEHKLMLKNTALNSLKKLAALSHGEESNSDLSTSRFPKDQTEYLEAIDSVISENRDIFDADEIVEEVFERVAAIMRSNSGLHVEINDQLVEINTLTTSCSDLEQKIMKLQSELSAAKKKVQYLEKEGKGKRHKLSIILSKCNASTQADVATVEESAQTILDHYLSDLSSSPNVNDLKEEIYVMSLTVEQKDKQLQDLKQDNAFLVARLEEAKNRLELNFSLMEDGYSSEVAKLHDQLARTNFVNVALVKELQNLEHFMENIGEYNSLDQSSFENLSDAPGSFSKLSKCLNQIRLLSSTLSENLSMCEGSRVFDIEEGSISLNPELLKSHLDLDNQGSPYLAVLQPNYQPCAVTNTKGDEGKSILATNDGEVNSSRAGKRRTWSNPAQHPIQTPIFNSDGVSILEVSDNEIVNQPDLSTRPINFALGSNLHSRNGVSANALFLSHDFNDRNSLPRRRCWGDDTSSFSFIAKDKPDAVQPVQEEISLNRYGANTTVGATWYNSCLTSDSDIWSEPDRDVSLQRIGIDIRQSPVPKSPSHKLRSVKAKHTTDEISSEKSSVPHGCVKAQSWSRRRRNSGSTPKRLLARKDSRLEKHLSLLKEECPRFVSLLHQFETTKEFRVEEPEVFADAFEVFKKLQCTICETTQALVQLKDNGKNGTSGCQKCLVNDLKLEIESSIEKLDSANVIEKSVGTAAEEVLRRLISEVDNLNRQLGETPEVLPSALRSLRFSSAQEQAVRGSIRKSFDINADPMRASRSSTGKVILELERRLSSSDSSELKTLINKLKWENEQLEAKQVRLNEDAIFSRSLCDQLESDLKLTKARLEKMVAKCLEMEEKLVESSGVKEQFEQLIKKYDEQEQKIAELQEQVKDGKLRVRNLERENDDLATENKQLDIIKNQLNRKLSEETKQWTEKLESEKSKSEDLLSQLNASTRSSENLRIQSDEGLEQSKMQLRRLSEKSVQCEEERQSFLEARNVAEDKCKKYEEEIVTLKSTVQDMTTQIDDLRSERTELLETQRRLESINDQLDEKLSEKDTNAIQLDRLNKELELEKCKSELELTHFKESSLSVFDLNKHLTEKLGQNELELEECNLKLQEVKSELENLIKEKNELINTNESLESKLNENEGLLKKLKEDNEAIAKNKEVETIQSELSEKCEKLNMEIVKLHEELSKDQEQLELLRNVNDELEELNKSLTEENKSLEKQINDSMVELKFKTSEMENTIVKLENQNQALKRENEHARGDLATTSSMTEQISSDLKRTQENLKYMEARCLNVEKELQDSLTTKDDDLKKIKDLELKCSNFERELRDSSTTKDTFIQKMQALKSKLVLSRSKLSDGQKMSSLSKVLSRKDVENKENRLFSISSKSELQNKDKQIEELCENIMLENDKLIDHIEGLVKRLSDSENTLQQSRAAEKKYQHDLTSIQNKLLVQETELNQLKGDLQYPDMHIHSSEEERQYNLATILQSRVKILQDEVANLKKQNEQAVLQKKTSEERQLQIVASIEKQLRIREDEIVDLKKQRDQALKQSKSFEIKHQHGIALAQNEVEEFKKHKDLHLAKIDNLIEENKRSASSLQSEIESLEEENRGLREQISEEKLHLKEKEEEILSLHEKVFNLQLQVNNLKIVGAKRSSIQPLKHKSSAKMRDSKFHDSIESDIEAMRSVPSGHSRTQMGSQLDDFTSLHSDNSVSYSKPEGLTSTERDSSMFPIKLVDSSKIKESDGAIRGPPSFITHSSYRPSNMRDSSTLKISHPSITSVDTNLSSMSMDTDSLYNDPQKLKLQQNEADLNCERLMKEANVLRERLAIAEDQVELLEKEKREIREHLSTQALDKKAILKAQVDEKLNFQLQLDKKDDFIKDLKNELLWTNNLLVDKQKEVINLERKISELERSTGEAKSITLTSSDSTESPPKIIEEELNSKLVNEITTLKNENFKLKTELMELQKLEMPGSQLLSDSRKSQYSFLDSESCVTSPDEEKIKELHKLKWNLIKAIFALEKEFCQERALDLNTLQSFMKHIENQYSLQFSQSLSKCISEPILMTTPLSGAPTVMPDVCKQNVLDFLEIDIECLQNIKIFLEKFVLPNAVSTSKRNMFEDQRLKNELSARLYKITQLETYVKQLENEKSILHAENSKLRQMPSLQSYGSIEKLRASKQKSTFSRSEESALEMTRKLSTVEDLLKSLEPDLKITELSSQTEISRDDTPSKSVKKSMLSKLVQETRELQKSAEKVFQLNSSIKAVCGLKDLEASKLSTAMKEFHFSDDTLTLSRSASISPISFEDVCPTKGTPLRRSTKPENKSVETISNTRRYGEQHSSSKVENAEPIGSSQDSVCHRSHFSSPDLGIESDPNHESSAPEQAEKDVYATTPKVPMSGKSEMELKFKYSIIETEVRWPGAGAEKSSAKNNVGAMGDSLCAISALQDYELLKQEIQESLVDIKSVISRTKDGLQHITKYASPRKSMEHSTFKAIRDTCSNIEIYLSEAVKLVDGFRVAPYPSAEEWNSLNQKNQELNNTLSHLRWEMQKQQNECNEAMKELQHAQLVKDSMEKKISKKLVKTKKVLKLAKMQLQEPNLTMCHNCHTTLPTKDQAVDLASHSSKGHCA